MARDVYAELGVRKVINAAGTYTMVGGSRMSDETLAATAARELAEETGIDAAAHGGVRDWHMTNVFEIYARWRGRFPEPRVDGSGGVEKG